WASPGIVTSELGPAATIVLPSVTIAAWWIGGTSNPVSSWPPTRATRLGVWDRVVPVATTSVVTDVSATARQTPERMSRFRECISEPHETGSERQVAGIIAVSVARTMSPVVHLHGSIDGEVHFRARGHSGARRARDVD